MFFCDECAEKQKWPTSFHKSYGPCEICEENKICNDVPYKQLPKREGALEQFCSDMKKIKEDIDNL